MKSVKRRARFALSISAVSACLVLAVTGCSAGPDESSGDAPEWASELVEPGVLTIGTSGNTVPYAYPDGGETVGYSIDQCVELAKRMDVKPKIEVVDFSGVMTGIQAGKYDVACSGELVQTEERKQAKGFYLSTPTLLADTGLLTLASNDDVDSFEDARGKKVGGVQGAAAPTQLSDELDGDVEIVLFPGVAEAVQGVEQGRVDFYAATSLVLEYYAAKNPDLKVVARGLAPTPGGLIISRNDALRDEINTISQKMLDDGTIADIQKKWFNTTALP